jgi:hypothetical protein
VSRLLAAVALAAFVAAIVVIAIASTGSHTTSATTAPATVLPVPTTTLRAEVTTVRRRTAIRLHLAPAGVYDPPPGDGTENDSQVPNAVDGDPATFWSTEHYTQGFTKDGVGIVLDVGTRRLIKRVLVGTDLADSRAEIRLGDSPTGPFRLASENQLLDGTTTFGLNDGAAGRYVVVWITRISPTSGEAHVTEVRAFAGP